MARQQHNWGTIHPDVDPTCVKCGMAWSFFCAPARRAGERLCTGFTNTDRALMEVETYVVAKIVAWLKSEAEAAELDGRTSRPVGLRYAISGIERGEWKK